MDPDRTVSRSLELTPELLSSQGRSLRALARSLLGDSHAAEDVEQETWLALLTTPARVHGRLSAWLRGVARHRAKRRMRGETRRRSREERAAVGERIEGAHEKALLREETLRSLTQALLALDEPYRTPLILRFFEDRSPLEIARELDLPASTVKSRIERGLELLRARLTAEHGGTTRWTSGLLLLSGARPTVAGPVGTGTVAGPITGGIGALLMGWKVSVVAAVAVAGSYVAWTRTGDEPVDERVPSRSEVVAAADVTASAAPLRAAEPGPDPVRVREPAGEGAQAAGSSSAGLGAERSYPFRVKGLVRDENDRPLPGALVFLAPRSFPVNRMAVTDDEGRFDIAFQARRGAFAALFAVRSDDLELGPIELQLTSRSDFELDVAVRRERVTAERWQPPRESGPDSAQSVAGGSLVASALTLSDAGPLERAAAFADEQHGSRGFWWPLPDGTCLRDAAGEIAEIEASLNMLRLDGPLREVEVRAGQLWSVESFTAGHSGASSTEPSTMPAVVRGIVRDAQGAPLPGAIVSWGLPGGGSTLRSDEDGSFELANVTSGTEVAIDAGGGDLGRASATFVLSPGEVRIWDPLLDRGAEVRGRLLGPDGKPIAHALVELWQAGSASAWNDATLTGADGAFAIPNVPAGGFEIHLVPDGRVGGFPARVVTRVRPNDDLGDLVLTAEELATATLRVEIQDVAGEAPRAAEVRVWQEGSRRGRFASEPDADGVQTLGGLPAGRYRIEVGCELGWRNLGAHWLAPGETLDLGPVPFERLGVFSIDVPDVSGREQLVLSALHPDVHGTVVDGPLRPTRLLLPTGSYRLTTFSDPARTSTVFRVSPDSVTGFVWGGEPGERALTPADPPLDLALHRASCLGCHATVDAARRDD